MSGNAILHQCAGRRRAAHLCMYDEPAPAPPAAVGEVPLLPGGSVLEPATAEGLLPSLSRCHLQYHCGGAVTPHRLPSSL